MQFIRLDLSAACMFRGISMDMFGFSDELQHLWPMLSSHLENVLELGD
jgi:hypothetical protein